MTYDFGFDNVQRFNPTAALAQGDTTLSVPANVATAIKDTLSQSGVTRYPLVLSASVPVTPGVAYEIVYATDADDGANTLTITRAREGTSAQSWNTSSWCQSALTAGAANELAASTASTSNELSAVDTRLVDLEKRNSASPFFKFYIEADGILDLATDGSEVQLQIPDGIVMYFQSVHILSITYNAFFDSDARIGMGTTSGATDISEDELDSIEAPNMRDAEGISNKNIGYTGTIYIHTTAADGNATDFTARIFVEGEALLV